MRRIPVCKTSALPGDCRTEQEAMMRRLPVVLTLVLVASGLPASEPDRKGLDFFEAKIRPMLVTHCYACHSAGAAAKKKLKGGLLLDSRSGSRRGGESGPAIVPGKPAESPLISALRHEGLKMPPKGKLPDEIIAHFVKWIEMGAPDPRAGGGVVASSQVDLEAGRKHWAFHPLQRGQPPVVEKTEWIRTPVDRFVKSRLERAGITANAIAAPRTLIRRAYFDLTGLPPSPEQVEQFVQESASDPTAAYGRLVDQLLGSRQYGERWARHWLDIVRFAESNGYAFDGDRPNAWHYRDFVIRALNSDLPYDQFVRQQLAGDLLTDVNVKTTSEARTAIDAIAATGFLVAGPYTTQQTQKERERSRYEQLDDMVSTLGTSLLGLTVGCCRCHSHKFDPLPQFDYYRMVSCFADVGFANTGINIKPEEFLKQNTAYNAALAPLVAKRTQYEKETQPSGFEKWLAQRVERTDPSMPSLTLADWHHVGPFPAASLGMAFEQKFGPEQKVDLAATYLDGTLKWTAQPKWVDGAVHNTFRGENSANYIFRVIESPEDQQVSLSLGSDDAIAVWWNGKPVLSKLVSRGAAAGQETVNVPVRKGRNELLMKIVNGGGPSGFYFQVAPAKTLDISGIEHWQHIGPFTAKDFNAAYDQVFGPELDTDRSRSFSDGKLTWSKQPDWKDGVAHNDKLKGTNSANYLVRIINSESPRVLALSLGSDDGIKLWVNGRQVLAKKVGRNVAAAGQEKVTVQLAAGRNEVLMKIVNSGGATGFYFAATAAPAPAEITAIIAVPAEKRNAQQRQKLVGWHRGFDSEWLRLNQLVKRQETAQPKPELRNVFAARVRGTTYQFGEDTYKVYHLRRGNADNKEQVATPGFLQVLMRTPQQEQHWLKTKDDATKPRPGRLGLADWLTDVEQGAGHLLARVMVNRLWYHHFGRGIVATPGDFGTRGARPSHPELLDWLAGELIRGGWKLKPLHKLIMTSGVYMQAGNVTASGRQHDPENLLYWRRGARRLDAETIRDSLLAVAGTLDRTSFGKGTLDQKSKRRSIYFTVKRSQLIAFLQLFDAPDTMQGIATRQESTVAPQALALLNSPIIREIATQFAGRVRPNNETSIAQTIDTAYRIALCRKPTAAETEAMQAFIERHQKSRANDANATPLAVRDFCHLILCLNEFVYID